VEQEGEHKVQQTDYSGLKEIQKRLQNYMFLWGTTKKWKESYQNWMGSQMHVLADDDIEKIVSE